MMGQLGSMLGMGGGGWPDPRTARGPAEADGRRRGSALPACPARRLPGAFNLPQNFPGLGGPKLPGLGGGFNPFGAKKK